MSELQKKKEEFKSYLNMILTNLKKGQIPNDNDVFEIDTIFRNYREELENKEKTRTIQFKNVLPTFYEKSTLDSQLLQNQNNILFLKQLIFQKLIINDRVICDEKFNDFLRSKDYVATAEFENGKKAILLTTKGWNYVFQNNITKLLKQKDKSFVISKKLLINPEVWDDITFHRAHILCEYYTSRNKDFLMFQSGENNEIYGCEIQNASAIEYSCAGIFNKDTEQKELNEIVELAQREDIEKLLLVFENEEELTRIKEKYKARLDEQQKLDFQLIMHED